MFKGLVQVAGKVAGIPSPGALSGAGCPRGLTVIASNRGFVLPRGMWLLRRDGLKDATFQRSHAHIGAIVQSPLDIDCLIRVKGGQVLLHERNRGADASVQ